MGPLDASREFVLRFGNNTFNYWFGYVANFSIVGWLLARPFVLGSSVHFGVLDWLAFAALGLLLWTFLEYLLHKYIYHVIHSVLRTGHDLHHEHPKALIGVPWYLTTVVIFATYFLCAQFFDPSKTGVLMGFTWLGYIGYCFIHHSIHHRDWTNPVFRALRKHHLIHHAKDDLNWGLTTTLWDHLLGTKAK